MDPRDATRYFPTMNPILKDVVIFTSNFESLVLVLLILHYKKIQNTQEVIEILARILWIDEFITSLMSDNNDILIVEKY